MPLVKIDCAQDDWKNILKNAIQEGNEAELVNFDYSINGQFCAELTISHALQFVLDPKERAGFFKNRI